MNAEAKPKDQFVHITYSGIGGMSEAVFSLLSAAVDQRSASHHLFFYGREPIAENYTTKSKRLGVSAHEFQVRGRFHLIPQLRMLKRLLKVRPSLVITHMTQPAPILLLYRLLNPSAKVFSVEHHSNQLKTHKDWVLSILNHWISHQTIFLTEDYTAQMKKKMGALLRLEKVSTIGNGIDTETFHPVSTSTSPTGKIGMQARMVDGKDFQTLLKAFQILKTQIPEAQLELAGDGPNRAELETLARDLELAHDVKFLGMLEQEPLIQTMREWEVLVLSTAGETMSRTIMEAQSLGVAVVASDAPGIKATIRDGHNGLLFAPASAPDLAEKLEHLLTDKKAANEIRQNARKTAENEFSAASSWQKFSLLISESFSRK